MKVGRYNYAAQFDGELKGLMHDIERMLVEGRYILGEEVGTFERAFGGYVGVPHVRSVNTGTDALTIALMSLGIGAGDEVVTHANTFYATVAAICLVGATPVLVDCDEASCLMNVDQVEAVLTQRTRALLPVHLYGKPTPMDRIMALAKRRGLAVIEDAAQAHGATWNGTQAGAFGTVGCFSFHPSKNLAAAGDGGAIVCHDEALAEEIRRRRELGQQGQNNHLVLGFNSKLDAIQARILSAKLPHLDAWNEQRRAVARRYHDLLAGLPLGFQAWDPGEAHVFHLFQVRSARRDALLEHLRARGIDAVIRYPDPIHRQRAFAHLGWRPGQFPVAERLARDLLCLPIRPDMAPAEIDWVAGAVRGFFESR